MSDCASMIDLGVKKPKKVLIYCSRAKERLKLWGITKSRPASKSNHQRTNRQRGKLLKSSCKQLLLRDIEKCCLLKNELEIISENFS